MTKLDQMLADYRLKWVNLVLKKGFSRRDVAKFSDHSANTISLWVKNYQEKGLEGLLNQSRAPLAILISILKIFLDKILKARDRTGFCALKIKPRLEKKYGIDISSRGIGAIF